MSHLRKFSAVAVVAVALVCLVQSAGAIVADPIAVPAGNTRFLVGHARGYQVYNCVNNTWTFAYPWAGLVDDNGAAVAQHFAGPTWQAADNSRVVATAIANKPSPTGSIPWLLLQATSTSGPSPTGTFIPVTYIQRVNTTGGLAPQGACVNGATYASYYTADYYFYKAGATG